MVDVPSTMLDLPFFTASLPGCGGVIKAEPAHFIVEEIPLYEAGGSGPHLYVCLTREGWTTRGVAEALARLYGLPVRDIGYAGLKDRHARCTQVFSLPGLTPEAAQRIEEALPFELHWARCHNNKLKVGHLAGNRFHITVTDLAVPGPEAQSRCRAIAAELAARGAPNFFGRQRFGRDGDNVAQGRVALLGRGPRDRWLQRLLISAYQSYLFNEYLRRRLALNLFDRLLVGDVAKKADTGGMFDVLDAAAEQPRYQRGEIHFTGPMFGSKMWAAKAEAGELETQVLADAGLSVEDLKRSRTQGTRRPARIWLPEIAIGAAGDALQLTFNLPKGSYATVIVREFTKRDVEAAEPDES